MLGRRALGMMLLLLAGAGCTEQFDATQLGVPVVMGVEAGQQRAQGNHFVVQATSVHAIWGIFTLSPASMQKALASQVMAGKAVSSVTIKVKSKFTDILVTGLTLGLIVPRTVVFSGVVTDSVPPR